MHALMDGWMQVEVETIASFGRSSKQPTSALPQQTPADHSASDTSMLQE
jgi:hypothetical protein